MNKIEDFTKTKAVTTITETMKEYEERKAYESRRVCDALRLHGALALALPALKTVSPDGYYLIAKDAIRKYEKK